MTPEECKEGFQKMRFNDPIVNRALMAQSIYGWSNEDTYAVIAWHSLQALDAVKKAHMEGLRNMPPAILIGSGAG